MSEPWCDVTAGGVRWHVRDDYRETLLGPDGLRLPEWLRDGRAQVVKHGPHRTVYRVALPGLSFFLKHYRLADLRDRLRQLVRPTKARIEFDRSLSVANNRVPTAPPLAFGEGQSASGRDSFLVTRSLEGTEALTAFLDSTLSRLPPVRHAHIRQRLAVALGEMVAALHEAGIAHDDLHSGNVLVRLEANDRPALFLIDLHDVRLAAPLDWRASRDNLVLFNHYFSLRASRADRARFWRAYWEERTTKAQSAQRINQNDPSLCSLCLCGDTLRGRARELEMHTWRSNLRFWRNRDRRCLGTNRYFYRVRTGEIVGHAVRDLDPKVLDRLLADPDAPFQTPAYPLLKDSRSSTVAEFDLRVNGVSRRVVYKRFRVTDAKDPWLSLVRRTTALRSWVYGHGFLHRLLPTPRPLAVFHRRRNGLFYEGYLLTDKLPDAADLHVYLRTLQELDEATQRERLRARVAEIASLVRELHRRHIAHRDLKACNLLVSDERVWFIDLVGVRLNRRLARRRCVQNLARLHASFCHNPAVTRTERLRFLHIYLQSAFAGGQRWKRWWREIAAATAAKVARNERSGRVLA